MTYGRSRREQCSLHDFSQTSSSALTRRTPGTVPTRRVCSPTLPRRGDWPARAETTAETWAEARRQLEASLRELADAVRQLEADELLAMVGDTKDRPLGTGVTCLDMLVGVLQHNAYHSGQIALLAKALRTDR